MLRSRNQLRIRFRGRRRLVAIFFIGSIRLRTVRWHQASRNFITRSGLVYSPNRWNPSPGLVRGKVHVPHDVETVEHVKASRHLLSDCVELLPPRVGTDEADARTHLSGERGEEAPQGLLGPLLSHPKQPLHSVDMVAELREGEATAPPDLINANGLDSHEIPTREAPFGRVLHVVPGSAECIGRLMPRKPLGPASQQSAVAGRELRVDLALWHPVDNCRTSSNRPVASLNLRIPRCATAARTETAVAKAGRTQIASRDSPSRSPSCWPGARSRPQVPARPSRSRSDSGADGLPTRAMITRLPACLGGGTEASLEYRFDPKTVLKTRIFSILRGRDWFWPVAAPLFSWTLARFS